ncbi:MAG: hypothetical protein WAV82_11875 [Methylobacter sp.]
MIESLKSELARAEASFAELSKRVDINHPKYKLSESRSEQPVTESSVRNKMVLSNIASGVASSNQRDKIVANSWLNRKPKCWS